MSLLTTRLEALSTKNVIPLTTTVKMVLLTIKVWDHSYRDVLPSTINYRSGNTNYLADANLTINYRGANTK